MKAISLFVVPLFLFSIFFFPSSTAASTRPPSMLERAAEARSERVAAYLERIRVRLVAFADYDELLSLRVEAKALELREAGEDTYIAEAEIKTAQAAITEARLLLGELPSDAASARAILDIARDKLILLHEHIGAAIDALSEEGRDE